MAGETEKGELIRLEDFIALAKEGKEVQLTVSLRKQLVQQKFHPEQTEEKKGEIDMYLLIADYSFQGAGKKGKVSKIYVSGTVGEPLNATKQNTYIANARLKMDYMRLREVDIIFEEIFWEERT
jgi:hypothetical protein